MSEPEPGHQHLHRHGPNRPESLGAAIANLRGTGLPRRQVLALVAANMRRKVVSRSACCGNHGQPGCCRRARLRWSA